MKLKSFVLGVIFGVATLGLASAQAATFTVDATVPIPSWLDTGLNLSAGQTYDFAVINPATIWHAGSDTPFSRASTANGIPANGGYGQFTFGGFTFNFGALVGELGNSQNNFFLIGTGAVLTGLSGELHVGYWDSFYPDNSGSQTLSVSTVPLPSTWVMMLFGLAGFGFLAYRGRRLAASILAA